MRAVRPRTTTPPPVTLTSPMIALASSVRPAPTRPYRPRISPRWRLKLIPRAPASVARARTSSTGSPCSRRPGSFASTSDLPIIYVTIWSVGRPWIRWSSAVLGSRRRVDGWVTDERWNPGRKPLAPDAVGDRGLRDQVVLLVDDADPRLEGGARGPKTNGRGVDRDVAGVRLVNAGEDFDQRALA